jgi:hypothetical protein
MALPEYFKEYCMDGHKNRVSLDGITVNEEPLDEFLKTEEQKEVESVYKENISNNSNKNPVCFGRPRFKSKKERNGKVKKITPEEYYNQDPNGNFGQCTRIKDVVISLLLSGMNATSKELFSEIDKRADRNVEIKSLISKEKFSQDKIYTIMWEIKKSILGEYLILTPKGSSKRTFSYSLTGDAKSFTLEKSIHLSKKYKKGLRKSVIRKAVKKVKGQREDEKQIRNLKKIVKTQLEEMTSEFLMRGGEVMEKQYKGVIESLAKEIQAIKETLNKLMINTPASDLKKSFGISDEPTFTIKVDIPDHFIIKLIK